ncbi:helix-turn-helix transcriptional regulator [Nocardia terpenica]|nr:helix-turn-helix transcriptional regulator [Nocardia terpenica]
MTNKHAGMTREHDAGTTRGNHAGMTIGIHTGTTSGTDAATTSETHTRTTSETHTGTVGGNHTEATSGTRAGMTRGNDAELTSGTHSERTSGTSADASSAGALTAETSAGTAMPETARTTTSETSTRATTPERDTRATTSATDTRATAPETNTRATTSATGTRATTPGRGTRATTSATDTQATTPETSTQATTSATGTWATTSRAGAQATASATDTRATTPERDTRATTSATDTQATTPETSTPTTTSATGKWAAISEADARVSTSATDARATTSETGRTAAAAALIQVARTETADRFLPVTPVSLAALLCLSMGEPRRALDALRGGRSVVGRANGSSASGHLLVLSAWVAMLGGDEQEAGSCVDAVHPDTLSTRDRLLAHGVAVGLARRGGDHSALTLAWQAAAPLFDDVGVDLLTLLPIGELWLAGIRLRDEGRIAGLVDAARELLRRLHNPPAWANAFHWYALQAAIAHERPDELLSPARQLKAAAAAGDPHAAVLADAGRTWVLVLRGQVDPEEVSAAVRRLAGIGLSWDAARLASEAALAAGDSATATVLLKLARTVRAEARPSPRAARPADPAEPAPPKPAPVVDAVLSEREREVAELVLLGLTYREIGARLYISSKTVEHHVARIRRRIGAGSRSELLSMLRAMGHGSLLV